MKAHPVSPDNDIGRLLPGAQFMDAYGVTVPGGVPDAKTAARIMVARSPGWVTGLMRLRNALVKPLGLKVDDAGGDGLERIGFFPILSETPRRIIFGLADKHLDFRGVVDVADPAGASQVTLTTLVRLHNGFGRAYLTAILPFHKMIVRAWLEELSNR
jgi:hypothetical protein